MKFIIAPSSTCECTIIHYNLYGGQIVSMHHWGPTSYRFRRKNCMKTMCGLSGGVSVLCILNSRKFKLLNTKILIINLDDYIFCLCEFNERCKSSDYYYMLLYLCKEFKRKKNVSCRQFAVYLRAKKKKYLLSILSDLAHTYWILD